MSAFGGKADIIQGKADIKKCPLMTQSGHRCDEPIGDIAASAISGKGLGYSYSSHRIAGGGGTEMKLPHRRQFLYLTAGAREGASLSGAANPTCYSVSSGWCIRRGRTAVGGSGEVGARHCGR